MPVTAQIIPMISSSRCLGFCRNPKIRRPNRMTDKGAIAQTAPSRAPRLVTGKNASLKEYFAVVKKLENFADKSWPIVRSGFLSWSASGRSQVEEGGTGVESATLTMVKELAVFPPSKVILSLLSDTVQLESPVLLNLMRWLSGKVPDSLKEANSSLIKGSSWTEDELGWLSSINFK